MSRLIKNIFMGTLVLLGVVFLIGCTEKEPPKLKLAVGSDVEVLYGETLDLGASVEYTKDVVVKYSSDDTKVATVDANGKITAVELGETTIRVTLEGFADVKADVKVTVKAHELSIVGDSEVFVGETIKLTAKDEKGGSNVIWDTESSAFATVDSEGNVTGVKEGVVNILIVSSITGEVKMKEINVLVPDAKTIEISKKDNNKVLLLDEVKLTHKVLPSAADQEVIWTSSDEIIATVDNLGNVKTHRSGEVEITATSVKNPEISGTYTLIVEVDPIELLKKLHVENPVHQRAKSNLIPAMDDLIYGSVNLYWNADMNLSVKIIPVDETLAEFIHKHDTSIVRPLQKNPYKNSIATKDIIEEIDNRTTRPGILKPEIKYITYHDTGNYGAGAGASMHADYMVGSGNRSIQYFGTRAYGYRSWHYTVDDKEIIQHLPDEEISFQGDTFDAIAYSIGVETAISKGSNFFTTWHRTAKLMASLLDKHNLPITCIEQHHHWSGKDCPQVLRGSGLWDTAIDLVHAEYLVLTELEGYNIEYISKAPEYVNNEGRIIKLDKSPKVVEYEIKITNNKGYNESVTLKSILPASLV